MSIFNWFRSKPTLAIGQRWAFIKVTPWETTTMAVEIIDLRGGAVRYSYVADDGSLYAGREVQSEAVFRAVYHVAMS